MTTQDQNHGIVSNWLSQTIPAGFERRALTTQMRGAVRTERDFNPTFGVVFKGAYSFEVDHMNDFDSILVRGCRELGKRTNALIELDHLIRDPRLAALISSSIFPRDIAPVDTKIPVSRFDEFRAGVRKAVRQILPNGVTEDGFVDIVTFLYGRPSVMAGFVLESQRTVSITHRTNLIPTYDELKSGSLATLLVRVLAGIKTKLIDFKGDRIAPKMLFETMRESLTSVSEQLISLRYQWDAFDALAAVAVGKLTGEFDMDPARAGFLRHPEVDQFLGNFTLVNAALELFAADPSRYRSALPRQVTAEAYGASFKGLVQAVVTSELFERVDLRAFRERTHLTRVFTPGRMPVALMIEPSFKVDPRLQVSYLANTKFSEGVIMTQMPEVERQLTGFATAVSDVSTTSIVDMHNVIVDVMFEDGDMLAAEAGATMALNAGAEPGPIPSLHLSPELMFRNCDETYIRHIAASFAAYMGLSSVDDDFVLTYFVLPTTPDINFLLTPITTGVAATEDAAAVVLLCGQPEVPVSRAVDKWPTGDQILDDVTRNSLVVDYSGDFKLFPDIQNSLDHKLKLTFNLSKGMAATLGVSKLTTDISIYQLLGGPDYKDSNIVQTHLNPLLHLGTTTMMAMLVDLYDTAGTDRGQQAVIASTTKLLKTMLNTREFQIIFQGTLSSLAFDLKGAAARMMFQRSAANQFDMVPLKINILLKMLLRLRLINQEAHDKIAKSKLFTSRELVTAVAVSA